AAATGGLGRLTGLATLIVGIGGWLPVVVLLAAGPWLLDRGASTGVLLGAVTYTLQGLLPALQTFADSVTGPGLWLMVTVRRVAETTRAPEPGPDAAPSGPSRPVLPLGLSLDGVGFAYSPWAEPVVQDLTLSVPAGEHLAVVGPSGIGKSTLAGLMTGLLRPGRGSVRLGGSELAGWEPAELARRRVLIPQEAYVFVGTVGENLRYLAPNARHDAVERAVDALGARDLVDALGGQDAPLDPGRLSSGERQLITLVRAYLSPACVVILDEATCHLDPAAEAVVERAFAARPGTLIVIAHRMSSALRSDRIVVMDGRNAQIGTHEELLAGSPLYQDLVGYWQGA
ncbi:MAG: ABC transporter ATP-binding protein, partial [Geodermatophilaceae bacterium]|nr:ABC transporter ATP-binding protein [Geodermatophilaceae bacterium]